MRRDDLVLCADSVGRWFGTRRVLKSATLWARSGEITALLGRNGEGKTTLVRIAGGILAPHHGVVHFLGRPVAYARLHRLARRGLAYLPQEGLLPRGRPLRTLARAMALAGARTAGATSDAATGEPHPDDLDARIARWAERWRLHGLLDRAVHELSGGERNRASVALTLLREPVCLLADEPLTASAPKDREVVLEALAALRDRGCAVVVTGHEARELLGVADRVVWLVAGTTRDLGSPAEALESHQFRRDYLGPGFPPGTTRAQAGASDPSPA